MPAPSVTHIFANSTTADATQVNTNFTDLINGASDGTKDYSINALTCAGAAALNGNVTLGNASSDDITFTGSMASHLPIKTTATYDIGSSTLGLRHIYLGNSTSTLRLAAPTLGASYNLTLPYPSDLQSKTGNYTVLGSDGTVVCSASGGAFTLTLPAAASFSNKLLTFKKSAADTSFNAITIDGNASETIDGATTTTLDTAGESVVILSDGSNWHIVDRRIPSTWTSFTPTGSWSSNTTYTGYWRRSGDSIDLEVKVATSGAPTTAALTINIPNSSAWTINTSKLSQANNTKKFGSGSLWDQSAGVWYTTFVNYNSTTSLMCTIQDDAAAAVLEGTVSESNPIIFAASDYVTFRAYGIPITGLNG